MTYLNISSSTNHCLSDFAQVVLLAHKSNPSKHQYVYEEDGAYALRSSPYYFKANPYYRPKPSHLSNDDIWYVEPVFDYIYCLSVNALLKRFDSYAKKATACDDKPLEALTLLKQRVRQKYYSGMSGKLCARLQSVFTCFQFENTAASKKIEKIAKRIQNLPKLPSLLLPKVEGPLSKRSYQVFTGNLHDPKAVGALGDYFYRNYQVTWMSPDTYLSRVDPAFHRHPDEESMPWLLNEMARRINGEALERFAPLMMDPSSKSVQTNGYQILEHEGRHRALAAKLLNIPLVPVAIKV